MLKALTVNSRGRLINVPSITIDHSWKQRITFAISIVSIFGVLFGNPASAQTTILDTSFAASGRLNYVVDTDSQPEAPHAMAIQPDGKIILAGTKGAILRLNVNGAPDTTFNGSGLAYASSFGSNLMIAGIALQSDGKIITRQATPYDANTLVQRYLPNGSLDTSFGTAGNVNTTTGTAGSQVSVSGSVANAFNFAASALVIQSDNKILVAGTCGLGKLCVMRLSAEGAIDTAFGTSGGFSQTLGNNNWASTHAMTILPDGRIVVAGYCQFLISGLVQNHACLMRLNPTGSLDTSFGSGTGLVNHFIPGGAAIHSIQQRSNGKLVLGGTCGDFCAIQLNSDGSLDTAFNGTGYSIVNTSTSAMPESAASASVLSNGKVLLSGGCRVLNRMTFCMTRLMPNGALDTTFGTAGVMTIQVGSHPSSGISTVNFLGALASGTQPSGRIVIVGSCNNYGGQYGDFCAIRLRNTIKVGPAGDPRILSEPIRSKSDR